MYSSYSTLQRKQLTKQVYTDTQSTYLLVYAPGRHQALEHALENQLHRKFRLVTELAPALTDSVEGVLLVSEDLECTSTALTYFAGALRTGADLVVCDAVNDALSRYIGTHAGHLLLRNECVINMAVAGGSLLMPPVLGADVNASALKRYARSADLIWSLLCQNSNEPRTSL